MPHPNSCYANHSTDTDAVQRIYTFKPAPHLIFSTLNQSFYIPANYINHCILYYITLYNISDLIEHKTLLMSSSSVI